jgi:hypothetical protein
VVAAGCTGEKDKVELLGKMATAAEAHFRAGGMPLFTRDELRGVVDYEEAEGEEFDPPPTEGDPDDDDPATDDPAAQQPPIRRAA